MKDAMHDTNNDDMAVKAYDPDQSYAHRIDPLFNEAFIRIFGRQSSRRITRNLLNTVFERVGIEPISAIDVISAEHTSVEGSVNCKSSRFDVRLLSANRAIDVEAQCYPEDIENRSLFYASQLMVENTRRGLKSYKDIPQVIVVTLLSDAPMFPATDEYVHLCQMGWDSGIQKSQSTPNKMLFVLVELDKIRKRYTGLTDEVLDDSLLAWSYLLVRGYQDEGEVESIVTKHPSIEEFAKLYGYAIGDLEVVKAYESFQSAELEYQSRQDYLARIEREAAEKAMAVGTEKGMAEGIEKGMAEGIEKGVAAGVEKGTEIVARQLLKQGLLDPPQIAEATGLSLDEIEAMRS